MCVCGALPQLERHSLRCTSHARKTPRFENCPLCIKRSIRIRIRIVSESWWRSVVGVTGGSVMTWITLWSRDHVVCVTWCEGGGWRGNDVTDVNTADVDEIFTESRACAVGIWYFCVVVLAVWRAACMMAVNVTLRKRQSNSLKWRNHLSNQALVF